MESGYMKRAVIYEKDRTPYLDCECGHIVSITTPTGNICLCGREYDERGWILRAHLEYKGNDA